MPGAWAIDLWKEKQQNEALQQLVPAERLRWLAEDKTVPTLALFNKTPLPESQGTILILPDLGNHPLQSTTIQALQDTLPQYGWNTLSIQLPIPDNNSKDEDNRLRALSIDRIQTAISIEELKESSRLVLLSIGASAALSSDILSNNEDLAARFEASVLINAPHSETSQNWRNLINNLRKLPLPVLDIYASDASEAVTAYAEQRVDAARIASSMVENQQLRRSTPIVRKLAWNRDNNHMYRQIQLKSGHPADISSENPFSKNIRGWLKRTLGPATGN